MRQLDGLDGHTKPWLPCIEFDGMPTDMAWCHKYSDRWPASIINPKARALYYGINGIGGIVIAPTSTRLFCAYSGDGNSMAKVCDPPGGDGNTCIPGCSPEGHQCQEIESPFECSYAPDHLGQALTDQQSGGGATRNNEMVVDVRSVVDALPHSIEGFWYTPSSDASRVKVVRDARAAFLAEYGLSDDEGPPLLILDLTSRGGTRPFRLSGVHAEQHEGPEGDAGQCEQWCNEWTCTAEQCKDCESLGEVQCASR